MTRQSWVAVLGWIVVCLLPSLAAAQPLVGGWGNRWSDKRHLGSSDAFRRLPNRAERDTIEVRWDPPKVDPLGNICTLSGQLWLPSPAGSAKPIPWPCLIAVHVSSKSAEEIDWDAGAVANSNLTYLLTTDLGGRFEYRFDIRLLEENPAERRKIQVAMTIGSLSALTDGGLVGRIGSSMPVHSQSAKEVEVPLGETVAREVRLINEAAYWSEGGESSAVQLIRAVNALRTLDQAQAFETIEAFAQLTNEKAGYEPHRDTEVIYDLVQCTFEPVRIDGSSPVRSTFLRASTFGDAKRKEQWPRAPLAIVDDIPFELKRPNGSGYVPFPEEILPNLRPFAVLRDEPLHPANNPLDVAEKLIAQPRFQQLSEWSRSWLTESIKRQAYAMVKELLPEVPKDDWGPMVQENWPKLLEASRRAKLRWDQQTQSYVADGPIGRPGDR